MSKPVIVPLWAFAALIGVLTWLVCRNTKTELLSDKVKALVDFVAAVIVTVTVIAAEYFR